MSNIIEKLKESLKKFKEDNSGFSLAMKRINSTGFCGNVNRGIKNGDFWNGSYVSIEDGHAVIYGSHQPDYTFTADDIADFEPVIARNVSVSVGNQTKPAERFKVTFHDGKVAQLDLPLEKVTYFRSSIGR